jgi:hypothetical protein
MNRKSILIISWAIFALLMGRHSVYGSGGDVLWGKTINFSSLGYPYMGDSSLTVSSTLCVVYGQALKSLVSPQEPMAFIKVYDMATGDLKW